MSKIDNEFCCDVKLAEQLCDIIGETVTIFTESGGQSGCGFTGTLLKVNPCFIRLIACIGPSPACALGNGCSGNNGYPNAYGRGSDCCPPPQSCNNALITSIGAVVDIPVDKIVAIVRNAI
ncbi:MAG TPA: hypothetical protein DEP72_07700 [Clostridiales bacterium]|nr:MAG: hypothetical protein A2Y18_06780 [Clostridiales bacterium GWD2_32_19]HCC08020.1 hypothetical protein [Clostridiales bacterium]